VRRARREVLLVAAGLLAGAVAGFLLWGRRPTGEGLRREYPPDARVRVIRVVDGDTVVLEDGLHLRYRGCDTPETYRFLRDPEPWAEEATRRNRQMVEGAWVRLRFPPAGMRAIDPHGRVLADVYLEGGADGDSVAEVLLREGLARMSVPELDPETAGRMRKAQDEARAASRGVWAVPAARTQEETFVASRNGRMIHRSECPFAERIAPFNRLVFHHLEAALQTGRGRCPSCLGKAPDDDQGSAP
jgi:micrococcal nuclease